VGEELLYTSEQTTNKQSMLHKD